MNVLSIDTSEANKITVLLNVGEVEYKKVSEQKFGSQVLLDSIDNLVKQAGIQLTELTDIKVAIGPGSFTGLRVGVSVANALGYALSILVNGKKSETELIYSA